MFERIHFQTSSGDYVSEDIKDLPGYKELLSGQEMAAPSDNRFYISGSSSFLLAHPMREEDVKAFLYLQSFSYIKASSDYYTIRKNYSSYLLLITYNGSGTLDYEGKTYRLSSGDGFLIDCRRPHSYRTCGDTWEHGDLHFFGGASERIYQAFFDGRSALFHIGNPAAYQHALEELLLTYQSASVMRFFRFSVDLEKLLLDTAMQLQIAGTEETVPETIHFLQAYLEHHYSEDLTIDDMAALSNTSKYHLIRQFKKYTGYSPQKYLFTLRLQQAENLLCSTDIPGYRIGEITGFKNEASFISHFKENTGLTPGEYRSRARH